MNRIKGLEKCTKSKAAYRFLTLPPSIIRRTVRICPTVDLFFYEIRFGFSGAPSLLRAVFCWRQWVVDFWCNRSECDSSSIFAKPKSPFFGNGSMQPSVHLSITSPLYRVLYRWSKMSLNFWVIAVIWRHNDVKSRHCVNQVMPACRKWWVRMILVSVSGSMKVRINIR